MSYHVLDFRKCYEMPLLDGGAVYFEAFGSLPDETLKAIFKTKELAPNDGTADSLSHLVYVWNERQSMFRPDFAQVRKLLNELRRKVAKRRLDGFLNRMSDIAVADEWRQPSEFYVHESIMRNWNAFCNADWREKVGTGAIDARDVLTVLEQLLARLEEDYGGTRGGRRAHDLGWIIDALALISEDAGGTVTISSHVRSSRHADVGTWVDDSDFVRFARAFIEMLPRHQNVDHVDVGGLVHRAFPNLLCNVRKEERRRSERS